MWRHPRVTKTCPVCRQEFVTVSPHPKEKTTCSRSCSNTFFRSGLNNGNHVRRLTRIEKGTAKRIHIIICWKHHQHECVVCGESLIVDVHHFNGDHADNRPENLVPLCPTHHKYWHSQHRHLILEKVNAYVTKFSETREGGVPLALDARVARFESGVSD
jgi:hypothetical protein